MNLIIYAYNSQFFSIPRKKNLGMVYKNIGEKVVTLRGCIRTLCQKVEMTDDNILELTKSSPSFSLATAPIKTEEVKNVSVDVVESCPFKITENSFQRFYDNSTILIDEDENDDTDEDLFTRYYVDPTSFTSDYIILASKQHTQEYPQNLHLDKDGNQQDEVSSSDKDREQRQHSLKHGTDSIKSEDKETLGGNINSESKRGELDEKKQNRHHNKPEECKSMINNTHNDLSCGIENIENNNEWQERYEQLLDFKKENGHCNVPIDYKPNEQLGTWVDLQRTQYRYIHEEKPSMMTAERISFLDLIGFKWKEKTINQDARNKKSKKDHVPSRRKRCNETATLKNLPKDQGKRFKIYGNKSQDDVKKSRPNQKKMETDNIDDKTTQDEVMIKNSQLSADVSFNFDDKNDHNKENDEQMNGNPSSKNDQTLLNQNESSENVKWNQHFKELEEFHQQNGHCDVPKIFEKNKALGCWVHDQRIHYFYKQIGKPSPLSKDNVDLLNKICFQWFFPEDDKKWQKHYEQLVEYKKQNGHCNVPYQYKSNQDLAHWVYTQRFQYKKMMQRNDNTGTNHDGKKQQHITLPAERIAALVFIGFKWNTKEYVARTI